MNQIFDIADSNLILTDARTGLNDFSMNEAFAKKLDDLSKMVTGLATRIQDKATELRDKIDKAIKTKDNLREIVYAGEVLDWSKKCKEAQAQKKLNVFTGLRNFVSKLNI